MPLEDKNLRDALRQVLDNASKEGFLTPEEAGFTNTIFKKLDSEIVRKTKTLHQLQGEIQQLKLTKRLIIDMIKDSIAAKQRAKAREETMDRLRSGKAARETTVVEEEVEIVEEKAPSSAKRKRTKKTTKKEKK
jgi:hypothetical protein